jgi:hypothetical protein
MNLQGAENVCNLYIQCGGNPNNYAVQAEELFGKRVMGLRHMI